MPKKRKNCFEEAAKAFTERTGTANLYNFINSEEYREATLKQKEEDQNIRADKKEGFVALFDILGFKNILENNDLDRVMLTYQQMGDLVEFPTVTNHESPIEPIVKTLNYSDTFLIYTTEVSDRAFRGLLHVSRLLFLAAYGHKMPIRGATAVGELYVSDTVAIGKPIVEAYKNERGQEWIGCWITQECIDRVSNDVLNELRGGNFIVQYPIPFKDGDIKQLYALNWIVPYLTFLFQPFNNSDGFLERKSWNGWAEERKHRNTRDFIDFISSLALNI